MITVERALSLGEAAISERCVVCDALSERSIYLEPVAGIAVDAKTRDAVSGRTVRACRSCEQAQADAKKYGTRAMMVAILSMPVVTLALGLVFLRPDGFVTTAGAICALVVARFGVRMIERRRAGRIPLLVIGADGDDVLVQVNAPRVDDSIAGYRQAPREARREATVSQPRPPRAPMGLFWAGSFMGTFVVGAAGWSGAFESAHTLVIDSPHDDVTITIDGGSPIRLAAGGRSVSKITSGSHTYRVTFTDSTRFEEGAFEVSAYDDTLITTDPAQCYTVWVNAGSHAKAHGTGWIRWTRIQNAKAAEHCANDR